MTKRTIRETLEVLAQSFHGLTVDVAREFIADDCVVHEAPSLPIGGDWRGPQGFVDLMQAVQKTFPNFRFEFGSLVTNDTDLVAFSGRISGDTPNGRFDIPIVEYWQFKDGKAVDILPVWHDTKHVMDLYEGTKKR